MTDILENLQNISCCVCGSIIPANPTGQCSFCLTNSVDITEGIEKNLVLPFCRHCNRYQRPPWLKCDWESKELLALCLKRIRALQSLREIILVDAAFQYTEPHSRRIKVRLTLQKEIVPGAILEHNCIVEYVIQPTQCDECKKAFTPHTWAAVVQIRQKVQHKRSLMYLEQVILKHKAHENTLKITESPDGMDAEFSSISNAQKFAEFVQCHLLTRSKSSKQLVSHDSKSNTAFYKHTLLVDICPICKDDLVFVPPKICTSIYGGISNFLLCARATTTLQLVDPFSHRSLIVAEDKFWKHPFSSILTRRHLTSFVVLNIETVSQSHETSSTATKRSLTRCGKIKKKKKHAFFHDFKDSDAILDEKKPNTTLTLPLHGVAYIQIARLSDFGVNDLQYNVRSHLGDVLRVGDHCSGYDLTTLNLGGSHDDIGVTNKIQEDVILVRKIRKTGMTKRPWVLKRLDMMSSNVKPKNSQHMDLEEFKCDLEDDVVLQKEVNFYKNPISINDQQDEDNTVLCHLLEDLTLQDDPKLFA
ncbi:60S ribosomal export protein NMD3-like [Hylaeus volcanicus]|uniref:60S ribosomal export protein NMD3-like n=1 Tax=Hylaeus volcanicus TaxID=313075 RepID=UPI0023B83256|nr:60S ribosomal export protein NMD3-like [Hylaeus volcanicus]